MFASFQKKYFLSDKGVAGVKRGIFWTTLTNLITMAGMGFLFLVMAGFVEHLASGADLPDALPIVGGLLVFFVLLFASNWQQYYYTYCIFYEECGKLGTAGIKLLTSAPVKNACVQGIACGMRIKNGYQDMVEQAKANVDDMVAEAAYITQSEAAADNAAE